MGDTIKVDRLEALKTNWDLIQRISRPGRVMTTTDDISILKSALAKGPPEIGPWSELAIACSPDRIARFIETHEKLIERVEATEKCLFQMQNAAIGLTEQVKDYEAALKSVVGFEPFYGLEPRRASEVLSKYSGQREGGE